MDDIKLFFIGESGTGKTTAIAAVSEIIAVDYGELTLETGKKIKLYAVEKQQHFDYLIKGATGIVLLINNAGGDPIGDLARYIDNLRELIKRVKTVIGITHMDVSPDPILSFYIHFLKERDFKLPVIQFDTRSPKNVMDLIVSIL